MKVRNRAEALIICVYINLQSAYSANKTWDGSKVTLKEIIKILKATVVTNYADMEMDIKSACSADMMSAVLYYHTPDSMLITGLAQPQVIRTAEIAGIKCIVFVLDKKPDEKLIELARDKNIPLLSTEYCMYTASGKLFEAGLPGCLKK